MPSAFPSLFLSHGAPNMGLQNSPVRDFMRKLGGSYPKPDAIIAVSAHFETNDAVVVTDPAPGMIYDFRGFEAELYEQVYPAPGEPELAVEVSELIHARGIPVQTLAERGFDHGTWVPFSLAWPEADIPIVQVSIDPEATPAYHYKLGQALAPLRKRNIAIVGTGQITHNLQALFAKGRDADLDSNIKHWVNTFLKWFDEKLEAGEVEDLLEYRSAAPHAKANHPTDEHLLPIFVAMGAAGEQYSARKIHDSVMFDFLAMDAWEFS